ncbi:MAG: hypothetical protein ABJE95_04900 [Byssovorax sp.]
MNARLHVCTGVTQDFVGSPHPDVGWKTISKSMVHCDASVAHQENHAVNAASLAQAHQAVLLPREREGIDASDCAVVASVTANDQRDVVRASYIRDFDTTVPLDRSWKLIMNVRWAAG